MSQISAYTPLTGPGSGTVTSITAAGGLTAVPNPIIAAGTITIDQTNLTVQDGTVYWDTGTQLLATTATGASGTVLTSGGPGVAPSYQAIPASGVTSLTGTANQITVSAPTGAVTLSIPITFIAPGSIAATTSVTASNGNVVITAGNLTLPNTNLAGTQGEILFGGTRTFNNFGTGGSNNFWGGNAGNLNAANTGAANNGFGGGTFQSITTGQSSTAAGNAALQNLTTGSQNSAYGASSGTALNTGGNSTLIGFQSGLLLQSGNSNVALGYQSGSTWGAAVSNNIAIGNVGSVADSGRIRIGTNGTQTSAFITGIDGVNIGSVAKVVTMASDQLGTATITAGTNISVTPGANTITIAATGAGAFAWSVITANQTAAVNNGYFCNKAGTLALALPAVSAVGDVIEVININTATGTQFTQAANQQIFFSTANTTLGVTGTLTSTALGDSLKLVCRTANLVWYASSSIGNWTPA